MKSLIKKVGVFSDPLVEEQFTNLITNHLRWLGLRTSDPDTTNWGAHDWTFWLKAVSTAASAMVSCQLKMFNGMSTITIC